MPSQLILLFIDILFVVNSVDSSKTAELDLYNTKGDKNKIEPEFFGSISFFSTRKLIVCRPMKFAKSKAGISTVNNAFPRDLRNVSIAVLLSVCGNELNFLNSTLTFFQRLLIAGVFLVKKLS